MGVGGGCDERGWGGGGRSLAGSNANELSKLTRKVVLGSALPSPADRTPELCWGVHSFYLLIAQLSCVGECTAFTC